MIEDPEVVEHVRSILTQVRAHIDDVSIHMTSNPPDSMVTLRMQLAAIGLKTIDDISVLIETTRNSRILNRKYTELWSRYSDLDKKIQTYRTDPTGPITVYRGEEEGEGTEEDT